jgi:acetyl esterase/lipase
MKKILFPVLLMLFGNPVLAQDTEYEMILDIPYYSESITQSDEYISERCVLDMYHPKNIQDFPTIVWFHGGGLSGGNKYIPDALMEEQICIVAANYRLHPAVRSPAYIEDAAAAVAWVFNNIDDYGGDTSAIFISGHSAGGYLTMMVGLDRRWLGSHGINADRIAGLIPFSGQTVTHSTIRKERGIASPRPVIDDLAPVYHIRADAPPLLLITGARELEMAGRYEENAYLMSMMKAAGHQDTKLVELGGYGHSMVRPAVPLLINEVRRILEANKINGKGRLVHTYSIVAKDD